MRGLSLMGALVAAVGCGRAAPPRASGLPGGEQVLTFEVISNGRHAGDAEIRIEPDGTRITHFAYSDRGRGPDTHTTLEVDAHGAPRRFRISGTDYLSKPIDEGLDDTGGMLSWHSTHERGHAPLGSGWYLTEQDGIDPLALLARGLRRAPGHRLKLLPTGEAWIDDDATYDVVVAGSHRTLRRVAIAGVSFLPSPVWLDESDEMFAGVDPWFSVIRSGAESAIPALLADERTWLSQRSTQLATQLAHRAPGGIAFTHARLYDSERRTVVPDSTVVVEGDRITAVGGPATPVPASARVIDAHGRTLMPGLWDMHVHLQVDEAGPLYLASGITTVRDMGNHPEELDPRVARFEAGTEVGPRVLRAGMIDASGEYAAPAGAIVDTLDQALAALARYADTGYVQLKIYNSIPPAWVPTLAAAAHARGMRVSGHIPNGMTAADAVDDGFDEIQHANFLFLRFLAGPGDDTRTALRITRVAEKGAELDLDGPEVTGFLDQLVAHRTVLDPTLDVFHGPFTAEPGELEPFLVPYEDRLPAQVVRMLRTHALDGTPEQRVRYRASYAAMLRLIKLAWDRKITIVAGTDRLPGLSLPHELELYVQAGIPAPEVLSIATIGAARVMHQDAVSGSIAVGKRADLALIDGDPTRDIASVRNTDLVVCRGVLYQPAELFTAVGMRPR